MLKTRVVRYSDHCKRVLLFMSDTARDEQRIGWGTIYNSMRDTLQKVVGLKFEPPRQSDEAFRKVFKAIEDEIDAQLRVIGER